jgi:hypothetical protein
VIKKNVIKTFHENGKIKCLCPFDENRKLIGPVRRWNSSGQLVKEIPADKCRIIFIKKRQPVDETQAKIEALEKRIEDLEARNGIIRMDPDAIRSSFVEFMTLIDSRSLMQIFRNFNDMDIAGAVADLNEQTLNRALSCVSKNRRKEILEIIGERAGDPTQVIVAFGYDPSTGESSESWAEVFDYSIDYKKRILIKIRQLEMMGEIVVAMGGGHHEIIV